MSKRPTFRELIAAYGDACSYEAGSGGAGELERQDALEALLRALHKSGLPLDQVAPQ